MNIKLLKEHICLNKKLIRLDNIESITSKGMLLKNGENIKLTTNELIKIYFDITKREDIDITYVRD